MTLEGARSRGGGQREYAREKSTLAMVPQRNNRATFKREKPRTKGCIIQPTKAKKKNATWQGVEGETGDDRIAQARATGTARGAITLRAGIKWQLIRGERREGGDLQMSPPPNTNKGDLVSILKPRRG